MGISHDYPSYSPGSIVMSTCLRVLTYSINDAYNRGYVDKGSVYYNLYNIGAGVVPALGNTKAPTFTWAGQPKWNPYTVANVGSLTSWGYNRLFALQAWNEFNYNSTLPEYRDFLSSFMQSSGFVDYSNTAITAIDNSKKFLDGTFSNMNDLITADITGVSTATAIFGQDLLNSGKAINLSTIASFGLPSNLLQNLAQNNASTPAVSLAMLASGLTTTEITSLSAGEETPTTSQQAMLYQAFGLVMGVDLHDVLVPLNCALTLTSLRDLLNPRMLFPKSYSTLTVPVFNVTPATTNSKTSYPIYVGAGTNSQLSLSSIKTQIGTLAVAGSPVTSEETTASSQVAPTGFSSYLQGIGIPEDIAVAAGAFGVTMQQIRNIAAVPIEKFAQIACNIETTAGLSIASTKVPANVSLVTRALPLIALGSGPVGTYTMSNFFGCMSGLPYAWRIIQGLINSAENSNLYRCYDEQYLAVTWQGALGHVTTTQRERVLVKWVQGYNPQEYVPPVSYDPPEYWPGTTDEKYAKAAIPFVEGTPEIPGHYQYDWQITGIVLDDAGGGYGRGMQNKKWSYDTHAPTPLVYISGGSGATAKTTIQINPNAGGTNNFVPGAFGRVTSLTLTYAGTWVQYADVTTTAPYVGRWDASGPTPAHPIPPVNNPPNPPLVYIECPPIGNGGVNSPAGTSGWPGMNSVIQGYTDQANPEIVVIRASKKATTDELNLQWDSTGTQLTLEQRARTIGLPPLPSPRSNELSTFPITQYSFVDAMPSYSKQIKPHMQSQTIEAITDMSSQGGPSMPAMMRETRNQERLIKAGIALDNNIEPDLPLAEASALIGNGSLPTAIAGAGIIRNGVEMTVPAYLEQMVQTPVDRGIPTLGTVVAGIIAMTNTTPIMMTISTSTAFPAGTTIVPVVVSGVVNPDTSTPIPTQTYYANVVPVTNTPITPTSVVGVPPTVSIPLYTDPALTIPAPGTDLVTTPDTGTALVQIGTLYIIIPSPNGYYDPVTETYILTPPGTPSTPSTPGTPRIPGTQGTPGTPGITAPNGAAIEPGSFAGNPYQHLMPPTLNVNLGSNTLLPSVPTIQEAIDQIIKCNCDCWATA